MSVKRPRTRSSENILQLQVCHDLSSGTDMAVPASRPVATPTGPKPQPRSRIRRARDRQPVILFLAANPRGTPTIDLARECAEIQRELAGVLAHTGLRFEARWAVSADD